MIRWRYIDKELKSVGTFYEKSYGLNIRTQLQNQILFFFFFFFVKVYLRIGVNIYPDDAMDLIQCQKDYKSTFEKIKFKPFFNITTEL